MKTLLASAGLALLLALATEPSVSAQTGCRSLGGIADHAIRRMKPILNIGFAWKAHPAWLLVGRRLCAESRPSRDSRPNHRFR